MEPDTASTHARGIIKEAGNAWEYATQGKSRKISGAGQPNQQKASEPEPEEIPPSAAVEPMPEPEAPQPKKPETPVIDPLSDYAVARILPETAAESAFFAPATSEKTRTQPPAEVPVKSGFSAEAAIAAYAAASASSFSDSEESQEKETPSYWPSPEVSQSAFQAPSAFAAASVPDKTEEPVPVFFAAASEPAHVEEPHPVSNFTAPPAPDQVAEAVSAFSAAPPESDMAPAPVQEPAFMFQAPPAPAEQADSEFQAPPTQQQPPVFQTPPAPPQENPASGFQAPPPEPQEQPTAFSPAQDAASAFRAAPVQPAPGESSSGEDSDDTSTDRVDDLLRQFRERYGKS